MRRFLILAIMLASAATGCQTVPSSQPHWRWTPCVDRAFDAGFCEQPTNFRLFGYISERDRATDVFTESTRPLYLFV